jgi:hypothetical protein
MAKRDISSGEGYAVGYGKPPKANQFSKGVSGNPKGRPKGSHNLATIVLRESRQLVTSKGPKGERKITKLEATVMQLSNKSAQGDVRASRELFALVQRAEEAMAAQPSPNVTSEADRKMMESVLRRLKEVKNDSGEEEK